jgi:hypothetical protein
MARIHLIDGEKGGVGKSLFTGVLIQYFLDKGFPFVAVEADRTNNDVATRYKAYVLEKSTLKKTQQNQESDDYLFEFATYSEDEKKTEANHLFELALLKPVVVNLPSQVANPLNEWIDAALVDAAEYGVELVRWFITSGSYESLHLFHKVLDKHGGKYSQILVKNLGIGDDWSELEPSDTPSSGEASTTEVFDSSDSDSDVEASEVPDQAVNEELDLDTIKSAQEPTAEGKKSRKRKSNKKNTGSLVGNEETLPQLIKKYSVFVIEFPKLPSFERNKLQKLNLTFGAALEAGNKNIQIMSKSKIKLFLKSAYEAIESTGLVP